MEATRCHDPYILTPHNHSYGDMYIPVNCGSCPYCKLRRINEWAFRLMQEHRVSESAHFVTLTYNTDNLPFTERGYKTLSRPDLRNFFKRLRKRHQKKGIRINQLRLHPRFRSEKKPIKYYACGEYGTRHKRPHYHAIIFNAHPLDILEAWNGGKDLVGESRGDMHFGTVTEQSCRYVMKYMSKEYKKPYPFPCDSIPEFTVQSKFLGHSYLTDEVVKWHKLDYDRNYVQSGKYRVSMPRYYRDYIWSDEYEKKNFLYHVAETAETNYLVDKEEAQKQGYTLQRLLQHKKQAEINKIQNFNSLRS